ncbi:MAG: autotransporter-associated beta strand repeat-containing protein, partial [Taibaiella sp.]|nr:autotransporter-associated beta strand repeat-containing protein [Taibaiella sp.]
MINNYFRNIVLQILFTSVLSLFFFQQSVSAQVIWISPTGTAWLTASNWTGGAIPSPTQVAQFNNNPTSSTTGVGINMDTASGLVQAAAIYVSTSRTNNLLIGNSSPTTPGVLTLNGDTISSVANVILANYSNNGRLTIQNTQGSGGSTLELNTGATHKYILTGPGTTAAVGNTINIISTVSGTGGITLLGGGTWNADSSTGLNGGILKFGTTNNFTGGVTIGETDGTESGILELNAGRAISNTTGNDITINPNSQLYLAATTGSTYTTDNITLSILGFGNNYTTTGKGAMVNANGSSYTWTGGIELPGDAGISALGGATTQLSLNGNISGSGRLVKFGSAHLVIAGTANTWTGGTKITNGKITVNSGSSLSNGILDMAQSAQNPSVVFNNATQNISALTSSFTSTTANNTIILNGTRLIINQNSNTTFGGVSSSLYSIITGTGSVVKNGTGTLTLTSPNSSFSGGLKIIGGVLQLNPSHSTGATNTSPDTLDGGTLSTDGISRTFTFTLGTLALSDNSVIDFSTDTLHSLRFSASSTITWNTGKILTIRNWTGVYNGTAGTKGRLYIGTNATGLTATQLAQIRFSDTSGNLYLAAQLSSGEVIPAAPAITTATTAFGPYCSNTASAFSVAFTFSGPFTGPFKVQLSGPTGIFPADFTTGI